MKPPKPEALSRHAPLFPELPEELGQALRAQGRRVSVAQGAFVHHKGDAPDGFYCVLSGRVRVSSVSADGRELLLADLGPGASFGEISLFDELPRTHDAVAVEPSELCFLPAPQFHALLAKKPALARYFLRGLAVKLRLCLLALDGAALDPLPRRLSQRLLWLSQQDASALRVSQAELAAMVSATRQSVNKQLKQWEREGVVALAAGRIVLLHRGALLRVAGL